jgi:hypothetical protein
LCSLSAVAAQAIAHCCAYRNKANQMHCTFSQTNMHLRFLRLSDVL